jgi:hypothetical protein
MKTKQIIKAVGIGIGAIALLTLIVAHPVNVCIIIAGAAAYFYADRLM